MKKETGFSFSTGSAVGRRQPSTPSTTCFRISGPAFLPNNKGFYRQIQKHGSV
jgi:hypothetical protein